MSDRIHQLNNIISQKCRITQLLREGGAGKTYEAEDLTTSQKVAITIPNKCYRLTVNSQQKCDPASAQEDETPRR
ncbi:MAG: hypothetical protein Tsb0014_34740 [Pleurocapsa sp.]